MPRLVRYLLIAAQLAALAAGASAAEKNSQLEQDKRRLAPLQAYVGEWRGIGLPKRGSNQGAWSETSEWSWQFADGRASLVAELNRDKYFSRIELRPGDNPEQFAVRAMPAESDQPVPFQGSLENGELIAVAEQSRDGEPEKISVRLVADGDRMLVLYERRLGEDSFARLAEVGSTRKGSSFAKSASTGP